MFKHNLVVGIVFSMIWIIRPISYDEMRSRHLNYESDSIKIESLVTFPKIIS